MLTVKEIEIRRHGFMMTEILTAQALSVIHANGTKSLTIGGYLLAYVTVKY